MICFVNGGIKGSEAGNSLNSILINLTQKSGQSAEAMKALGLNAYDAEGKFKGITEVLKEVDEKTKDLTAEQRDNYLNMIGGKTQIATLNALMSGLNTTNAEGVNELEALQRQLVNSNGALDTMADTVNDTLQGAFYRLSSAADDFKIEFISQFSGYITPAIDKLAEKIPSFTEKMGQGLEGLKTKFSGVKDTALGFMTLLDMDTSFAGVQMNDVKAKDVIGDMTGWDTSQIDSITGTLGLIRDTISVTAEAAKVALSTVSSVIQGIGGFVISHLDEIAPIASMLAGLYVNFKLVTAAVTIWNVVSGLGAAMTTALGTAVKTLTGPIGIASMVITAVIAVGVLLYKNWDTIKAKALELWESLKTTFNGIKDSVVSKATELWEGMKEIFEGIKETISGALKGAANAGIGALNMLIRAANKIKINVPEWVPGVGGKEFGINIPEIPALAAGGIVTKPTMALIGEGNEDEVVFPLSKLEQFLQQTTVGEQSSNVGDSFAVQIEFAPQIIIQGTANQADVETALQTAKTSFEKEFPKLMEQWIKGQKRPRFA